VEIMVNDLIRALLESSRNIYGNYFIRNYYLRSGANRPSVLISYLPFPFRISTDSIEMRKHQNRREAIVIGEVFKEFGFNADVIFCKKKIFLPHKDYSIVFGQEPNFEKYAKRNPKAIKIYFATGSYWKYQNSAIIKRTQEVNKKRKSNLEPSRLVSPHESAELADWIIQIGSKFTISTYPPEIQHKIILVSQSSFEFLDTNIENKNYSFAKKKFLWFGGKGAILKGLDLLLEAFVKRPDLELFIAGAPEKDFVKEYANELFNTRNIHFLGWLDIKSEILRRVADSCAFVILPSASEGVPGSVISMMRLGLVPVVSIQAAVEEIEYYGFLIHGLTIQDVLSVVDRVSSLDEDEIYKRAKSAQDFAKRNITIGTFKHDFKNALRRILNPNELEYSDKEGQRNKM
jgi:glycosyltransferase involved in cell wall biosynthesis